MYYDFLVKVPENTGKITFNKRNGATYVEYTYDRKYIPEKKYNVALRTTIGKIDPTDPTMMYPNPNFEKYFPDVVLPDMGNEAYRSSCIRVGAYMVVRKTIEESRIKESLPSWNDRENALLLELAAYALISEHNTAQHYPDYAYNHPGMLEGHKIYSGSEILHFLKNVTEEDRENFLERWNREHVNSPLPYAGMPQPRAGKSHGYSLKSLMAVLERSYVDSGSRLLDKGTKRKNAKGTASGNSFAAEIALLIADWMAARLSENLGVKPDARGFAAVINELEKIELIRQPGGNYKLDHALTEAQKKLLGTFGLDELAAKALALEIGKELMEDMAFLRDLSLIQEDNGVERLTVAGLLHRYDL